MTNTLVPSGGTAIEITDEQQIDDVHRVITLNMGPQHPSTHGVFRVVLDLEGEVITSARPVMGYLHRGVEKLFENHRYPQLMPWTDRTDYAAAPANNLGICVAIEKLCGVEVPERAEYFRVVLAELSRISSHLLWLGTHALDIGALSMVLYAFRERELILDLFDIFCGARLTTNIMELGGFTRDIPDGWIERCRDFIKIFPARQQEYVDLLSANPIWLNRTKGIGIITAEDAIAYSLTGPMIRGSGVAYDIRKARPYLVYDRLDWEVPIGENGDTYDRYLVRMEEMRQSLSMIEQCLDQMPTDGSFLARESNYVQPPHLASQYNAEDMQRHFVWTIKGPRPPKGEVYVATEGPKGEIGFYIISDGSPVPYRLHYRAPSFVNLQILPKLAQGAMLADMVALIGTIDIVLGDVDR
jgi:NADH-quinone oxidoreductase subunit D